MWRKNEAFIMLMWHKSVIFFEFVECENSFFYYLNNRWDGFTCETFELLCFKLRFLKLLFVFWSVWGFIQMRYSKNTVRIEAFYAFVNIYRFNLLYWSKLPIKYFALDILRSLKAYVLGRMWLLTLKIPSKFKNCVSQICRFFDSFYWWNSKGFCTVETTIGWKMMFYWWTLDF